MALIIAPNKTKHESFSEGRKDQFIYTQTSFQDIKIKEVKTICARDKMLHNRHFYVLYILLPFRNIKRKIMNREWHNVIAGFYSVRSFSRVGISLARSLSLSLSFIISLFGI
jgi:hypothetical protein